MFVKILFFVLFVQVVTTLYNTIKKIIDWFKNFFYSTKQIYVQSLPISDDDGDLVMSELKKIEDYWGELESALGEDSFDFDATDAAMSLMLEMSDFASALKEMVRKFWGIFEIQFL